MTFQNRFKYALIVCAAAVILSAPARAGVCRHCVDFTPKAIVLPAKKADDPGLRFAAQYLADTMGQLYATAPVIVSDKEFSFHADQEGIVVVGRDNEMIDDYKLQGFLYPERMPPEALFIKAGVMPRGTNPVIVVHGNEQAEGSPGVYRGMIFGLTYLAERLMVNPRAVFDIDEYRAPRFPLRLMSGDDPETALKFGYNTVFTPHSHANVVLLEEADPDMFYKHGKERDAVAARRREYQAGLTLHRGYHLDSISSSDEFEFHRAVLKSPFGKKITPGGDSERICFCAPETWQLYTAKYNELFRDFPGVDYTMIRLGENYAEGDYFGNTVVDKEFWNYCPACQTDKYDERIAKLIKKTLPLVTQDGRRYIHRTWDTNSDTFHSNPEMYRHILDLLTEKQPDGTVKKLPDIDNLIFSVKYTATDFWRYNFPNATIGEGDVAQIIEFQCQREYEGKGAFPNFIGEQLSEAYRYSAEHGAAGIWNWHHGGGWNGPYLKTDMWNQANIYAAAHLAWNPDTPAETLAYEWALMNFGKENADTITEILLLSDDAVLKLVYFEAYADLKDDPWMPNENWVRDDVIKGGDRLRKIYDRARDFVPEMVQEKEQGVRDVEKMLLLAENLVLPEEEKIPIVDTLWYELRWARVLRSYAGAYFYFCRWQDTGSASDRKMAEMYSQSWLHDWGNFQSAVPERAWVASLYRDDGMEKTIKMIFDQLPRTK